MINLSRIKDILFETTRLRMRLLFFIIYLEFEIIVGGFFS